MDAFDGHLAHCRRVSWGSIYRPIYAVSSGAQAVGTPVPYPVPSGAFFIDIALQEMEVDEIPPQVSTLMVYHGKRSLDSRTWQEAMASQRVAAIRKWSGVLLQNLLCFTLGRQLSRDGPLGPSLGESLKHVFANKSTGTLHNRVGPLLRYIAWAKRVFVTVFPIREENVYRFMLSESTSCSPTFLRSLLVSLAFSWHILGLSGAEDAVTSKRVSGLAHEMFLNKRKTRPRDPLTVDMTKRLEDFVQDPRALARDRVAAGCFLLCLYMRARYSDMLVMENLLADEIEFDGVPGGYIEASVSRSKTSYTTERKTRLLPMAAPRLGVGGTDWFKGWQRACIESGVPKGAGIPLLPAPSRRGWNRVPLKASDAGDWLRKILHVAGVPWESLDNTGTHSLKATCLSWCAKFGVLPEHRRHLGYHTGPGESTMLLYSRDAVAQPLRDLERVLGSIRSQRFKPDNTRSGYFVAAEEEEDVVPEAEREPSVEISDSSSEDSADEEEKGLDLEKEESAQEEVLDEWAEHARVPQSPEQSNEIFRNKQTRFVHLIADEAGNRFHCGRTVTANYFRLDPPPKFLSPQCQQCFRHLSGR